MIALGTVQRKPAAVVDREKAASSGRRGIPNARTYGDTLCGGFSVLFFSARSTGAVR